MTLYKYLTTNDYLKHSRQWEERSRSNPRTSEYPERNT